MDQSNLDELLDQMKALVVYNSSPEKAAERVARIARLSPAEMEELKAAYSRQAQKFIELTDPRVLRGNARIESWYTGPDFENAWCWPAYKGMLAAKWPARAIARLDESSTKILAHLSHPSKTFATRGLVVGHVQSGKTANYSALISKAADVGYKLFIVLAGTTSSLRQQTQRRLEKDIVALNPGNWNKITGPDRDFGYYPGGADATLNPANQATRILGVVKKNKTILENLRDFLGGAGPAVLSSCPVLVIDDEADNASVNTKPEDRTTINRLILEILGTLPKCAYVGYTATPFANVFIDPTSPEDLFPRDFIFDLPRPDDYFGAEKIFGRDLLWFDERGASFDGLDVVRRISDDDQACVRPPGAAARADFEPSVPQSLEAAIEYFLLATACRYARGQREHSSMLVHTTQYVSLHLKLKERVDEVLRVLRTNWKRRQAGLRDRWLEECATSVDRARGITDYDALADVLPEVLSRCEVVVDNGLSSSRLQYPENDPKVFIAIGGNTLSRGLTLEGLVVSYFVRSASAYDTLLQMGRWFGYRFGYEDLPRVWMTDELQEYFLFLAEVEEEVRWDVQRLEKLGKTPMDLAIRVRTHPKLQITARNKMGGARLASVSYSEQRTQSFLFKHEDRGWLEANLDAGRSLLATLRQRAGPQESRKTNRLFRDVPGELVESFLRGYRFHEDHEDLRQDLLLDYIGRERQARNGGALNRWNVGLVFREGVDGALGSVDLGLGSPVPCINRSRFRRTLPCSIKALTSARDRVIDLDPPGGEMDEDAMRALREIQAPGTGLLLLYPISKDSYPAYPQRKGLEKAFCPDCRTAHLMAPQGEAKRHLLQAAEHVLGAAIIFPRSSNGDEAYMSNSLPTLLAPGVDELDAAESLDLEAEVRA